MNETRLHEVVRSEHGFVLGSWFRRLPKVVAALPAGASRSSAPPAARRAAVRRFVRRGIWVLSGGAMGSARDDRERRAVALGAVAGGVVGVDHDAVAAQAEAL